MPTYGLTDESKANIAACGCTQCGVECTSCPVAPATWTVTLAGITDGTCSDCETWNRQYLMTFNPTGGGTACVWTETISLGCSVIKAQFSISGGTANFALFSSGGGVAAWELGSGVNCFAANVLTLSGAIAECSTLPATVTVSPA